MQERRTTIRKSHYARMQYCPAEDLELRDGRLTDVSERGAGVLARERHRSGELVTLGFSLPDAEETLTATGVIRWSGSSGGHWHRTGVEWLPLEDAVRNRLHQFVETAKPAAAVGAAGNTASARRIALIAAFAATLLISWALYRWVGGLVGQNRELTGAVEQRDTIIHHLGQDRQRLKLELGTARRHLSETAGEVARLDVQTQLFGREVERLNQDVDRFQRSYLQARDERSQLMEKVLALEQEKASLAKRLSSVDELKLAIQEAIENRKQAQQAERLVMLKTRRDAQERWLAQGNRGYLVRDGRPTVSRSTVWIRVREPESIQSIAAPPIEHTDDVDTP